MPSNAAGTYDRPDERVLVLLPKSRDAASMPGVLERMGVAWLMCATPEELCAEIDQGAGAVLIQEEALSRAKEKLVAVLERQPRWSELPIIVLVRGGPETQAGRDALLLPGDVTLVERPVRVNTLVATVRSALGGRRRQYLVRDQLRALEESERRYRTLFDSIDEGFCIIEMIFDQERAVDYRFLEANPAFVKHTGLVDVQGKRVRELVPQVEEYWFQIFGWVALTGRPVRFQRPADQLHRWYDLYAFRFGPAEERHVAIVFNDITERKRAESELREAKDELEVRVRERTEELSRALLKVQSETEERLRAAEELRLKDQLLMRQGRMAAMGEMIGFIGHQWRQPLNSLALLVQEVSLRYQLGNLDPEFLKSNSAEAMRVIRQMSQTIDDFSNFFKPDKRKVSFVVKEILANTLKIIEPSFRQNHVAIEVIPEEDVVVEGFPNEYTQVLLNILVNARDVILERKVEQPRIVIRIFRESGKAVMTIADNAGGIPEAAMERLFDPYFTTKGPDKGTGVGLYMAKTIIEKNMGGRLSARNAEDGAEFRIEV